MIDLISRRYLLGLLALLMLLLFSGCSASAMPTTGARSTYHAAPAMAPAGAPQAAEAAGQVPPGALPPTDMFFDDYGVNPFVPVDTDPLSTFAVDVDTGSYTVVRNYLTEGWLPPADAVRVEEFVNYFDYGYPMPDREESFTIVADAAPSPFMNNGQRRIMWVGIQGYAVPAAERQDVALTFIVDVSGSMDYENRLGLVKRGLTLLTEELRTTDAVAIVVYGTDARLMLPMTPLAEKETVLRAIRSLRAEGSTNAEAGLRVGYRHAWENFRPDANNRIVLASDGVANVGEVDPDAILRTIEEYASQGLTLTTVGFGMGNYNDVLMEQLADNGNGFYAYVDTLEQARKLFVDDLTGTLQTIALDARVQVEFNPALVSRYRLVGYENRDMADEDFRNDEKDAGEIGAGHSVTALYEIELRAGDDGAQVALPAAAEKGKTLATVYLRWRDPATAAVSELTQPLTVDAVATDFASADPGLQLATAVAAFGEVLRQSPWAVGLTLEEVLVLAEDARAALRAAGSSDEDVTELLDLIWSAADMMAQADVTAGE